MGLKESGLRGSLRNVSVGIDAIPDVLDNHFRFDEGSGTALNDDVGDLTATSDVDNWESAANFVGGLCISYSGDEGWITDERIGVHTQEYTVIQWIDSTSFDDDSERIIAVGDDNTSGDITGLRSDGSGGLEVAGQIAGSFESTGTLVDNIPNNEQYMVVLRVDGSAHEIILYDTDEEFGRGTGTYNKNNLNDGLLSGMMRTDGQAGKTGRVGSCAVAQNTAMSDEAIDQYHNSTKP